MFYKELVMVSERNSLTITSPLEKSISDIHDTSQGKDMSF